MKISTIALALTVAFGTVNPALAADKKNDKEKKDYYALQSEKGRLNFPRISL